MLDRACQRLRKEWPTWAILTLCYSVWGAVLIFHEFMGWLWVVPATLTVTLHSSLQHEALHGHPTASAALNEALVYPAIGLFVPYGRFRDLHLTHHDNSRLTDPYDDPESWYVAEGDWSALPSAVKALLQLNATLAGRLVLGPALALAGMVKSDLRQIMGGDRDVTSAWLHHVAGLLPVLIALHLAGIDLLTYAFCAAYPGMSILMIRTFIEHRAAEAVPERTAVVEAGWLMRLLFLNNNLHAVHHRYPALSWHRLPRRWREERASILLANADYHYPGGYSGIARQFLFHRREPLVHPFLYRKSRR